MHPQESVFELPRELRQLEVMRRERQEWAADHYPVTEQGLLDRYNPRARSPSQTLPAAEVNSQQHATVDLPSQVDPLLSKSPTSPRGANGVLSVDVCASPGSAEQPPVSANSSDLGEKMSANSSLSLGAGRGYTEVLMNTAGRGSPFGKEKSSIPALRSFGRGFLLQTSQAQVPRESIGNVMAPSRMGLLATSMHLHKK